MDTLLALIIALGGIATGIGALWAALVARRQAQLTERSFKEQNEIARSQARLTEQSLTQTESSLAEQNERLRLNLAFDLLIRLQDRFDSPHFLGRRRAAAKWFLENVLVDDDILEVERVDKAVWDMLDFFEEWEDPALYDEIDYLGRLVSDIDRERGIKAPAQGQLRETMEYEAFLGKESPTTE
jgi:hypothetical protein